MTYFDLSVLLLSDEYWAIIFCQIFVVGRHTKNGCRWITSGKRNKVEEEEETQVFPFLAAAATGLFSFLFAFGLTAKLSLKA
jgi:hypothetical protein